MGVEDVVRHVRAADESLRQAVIETKNHWYLWLWLPHLPAHPARAVALAGRHGRGRSGQGVRSA
jgi:hypothetical protein